MIRTLSLLTLVAVLLSACKPTERTALKKKQMEQQAAQVVAPPQAEPAPQPAAPAPIPAPAPLEPADCQLVVAATHSLDGLD